MTPNAALGAKETQERKPRGRARFRPLARDREIVRWTYEAGVTTREQVSKLLFTTGGRSRCQQRLTLLFRNRYLDRLPGRQPNQPDLYLVGRRAVNGLRLLRAQGTDARPRAIAAPRLAHQLEINACRVQLTAACRKEVPGLLRWLGEDELRLRLPRQPFLPDAFFQMARQTAAGERTSAFFLEVERSDKSDRALREKFLAYGRFYYGGDFERSFGTKALRVLFLIGDSYGIRPDRHIEKLVELAAAAKVTLLRFAPLRAFTSVEPAALLSAALWRRPDQPGFSALFEKGTPHDQT